MILFLKTTFPQPKVGFNLSFNISLNTLSTPIASHVSKGPFFHPKPEQIALSIL